MNMRTIAQMGLGLVFVVSAATKIVDLGATILLMRELFPFPVGVIKFGLGALIYLELMVGGRLVLFPRMRLSTVRALWVLYALFIGSSLLLWWTGASTCGCFGPYIEMSPSASVVKTMVMMILTWWLWRTHPDDLSAQTSGRPRLWRALDPAARRDDRRTPQA